MFALHSLHHYVAIPHSGKLNCPLTLSVCVLCAHYVTPLSAQLCPVGTQWQPIVLDTAFKMETICVLYGPGQCGSVSLTRQPAVCSDDPNV